MKGVNMNNCIVISDTHCGCQFGLCPPQVNLDGGGVYKHSKYQAWVWNRWLEFIHQWVPKVTRGEDYCLVLNGDALDGVHHKSNHQITHNLSDQKKIVKMCLSEILKDPKCKKYYHIRGTEAHVGPSGQDEEDVAKDLGAIPDSNGNFSRFELWLRVGKCLCQITHHIGTTGSMAYESSAPMRELENLFAASAQWGERRPDIIVRSHRHRHVEVRIPTDRHYGYCFTTSGWQLKSPFVYKIPGGRHSPPMIGGSLIRQGDEEFYTRHCTWTLKRDKPEVA